MQSSTRRANSRVFDRAPRDAQVSLDHLGLGEISVTGESRSSQIVVDQRPFVVGPGVEAPA